MEFLQNHRMDFLFLQQGFVPKLRTSSLDFDYTVIISKQVLYLELKFLTSNYYNGPSGKEKYKKVQLCIYLYEVL